MKILFFIFAILLNVSTCFSQTASDSLNTENPPDSVSKNISNELDTSRQIKSDVDAVINYSAADSLIYDLKNIKVYLYNKAVLTYKDLKLEAGRITVDQGTLILEAYGIPDSIRPGKFVQSPLMFQGTEKYEGAKLTYNFKNQQGSVSMGFSDAEVGYYFGDKIKKVTSDVLFIKNGIYTTSTDREDPEYYFLSPKMKVIPNDKVIAQSVFIYIEGVPVFWIPFGVFPNRTGRSSGLIPPKFGDDGTYGNYFSRLGYFWAISNFTDAAFITSYFSKGRIDLYGRFRYAKKYNYSGSVEAGYSRIRLGESTDIGTSNSDAWNLTLAHNQQINPTSRFDASLTFTSGKNYYNVSTNSLSELLQQNIISNVTYSKNWENTPYSLNVNYYRDQNLFTGDLRERIPLLNFSITQTFPFESATSNYFNKKIYEYLSFSYNGSILNNRTNIKNPTLTNPDSVVREFRSGIRHSLNFNLSPKFEFISFSPFFNYSEIWYNKYVTKNFNPFDSSVITNDVNAIKSLRYFNTGVSFSTRFVGIFTPRIFNVRGIRHTITPAISYVYQPDFSDPKWGYYNSYLNEFGQQVRYSIFEKEVFRGAPSGESQSLAFTIGNVFEMKTYVNDTTENKFQLFNIDAGINYNFAADSLKFSPLFTSFRTNIGSFLNISGAATFNLYKFDTNDSARINQFLINTDGKLANITSFNISMSTSFDFGSIGKNVNTVTPNDTLMLQGDYEGISTTKLDEVSFNIPFSGGLGFNYSESRPDPLSTFRSSNLSGNIAFNLTEKWRFTFSTSYDILSKQIVAPYITAYRDLNSWEMNFNWYPTGTYRGFSLEVRIKAPQLNDIKISKQTNVRGVFN
ncbi:MAG: LPS-assembly protein LptD [Bacteroidota bacterium]|nr:LPS-assembly protein LptD [Bacteroidota bacterium]